MPAIIVSCQVPHLKCCGSADETLTTLPGSTQGKCCSHILTELKTSSDMQGCRVQI